MADIWMLTIVLKLQLYILQMQVSPYNERKQSKRGHKAEILTVILYGIWADQYPGT